MGKTPGSRRNFRAGALMSLNLSRAKCTKSNLKRDASLRNPTAVGDANGATVTVLKIVMIAPSAVRVDQDARTISVEAAGAIHKSLIMKSKEHDYGQNR